MLEKYHALNKSCHSRLLRCSCGCDESGSCWRCPRAWTGHGKHWPFLLVPENNTNMCGGVLFPPGATSKGGLCSAPRSPLSPGCNQHQNDPSQPSHRKVPPLSPRCLATGSPLGQGVLSRQTLPEEAEDKLQQQHLCSHRGPMAVFPT